MTDTTAEQPTAEQLANTRRLADVLDKVAEEWPEHFAMASYIAPGDTLDGLDWNEPMARHEAGERPDRCGTTGCALGWAPYALGEPFAVGSSMTRPTAWRRYARDVLGVTNRSYAHLFLLPLLNSDEYGAEAARDAAARLRAWADRVDTGDRGGR